MLGLFFGGREFKTVFGNDYGNVEIDAVFEEKHEWAVEPTTNPVEDGAPVTDHIIDMPDLLILRGFITDAPLTYSASFSGFFNDGAISNRTQTVFDLLYQLNKIKLPMTVYTKYMTYKDMVLTRVTIPRIAGVGEAFEFNAEFTNIRKVETQIVDVPDGINPKKTAKAGDVQKKADAQKDAGTKQPQAPSSALNRMLF